MMAAEKKTVSRKKTDAIDAGTAAESAGVSAGISTEDSKDFSFEEGCKRLEEIVAALSSGNVTLEKNIELYSEGSRILKDCLEMLDKAKGVIRLVDKD